MEDLNISIETRTDMSRDQVKVLGVVNLCFTVST